MTESIVPAPSLDPADVDGVIQAVRFELYRENIYGALELLDAAQAARPHARYMEQATRIRSWLGHLGSREAAIRSSRSSSARWRRSSLGACSTRAAARAGWPWRSVRGIRSSPWTASRSRPRT